MNEEQTLCRICQNKFTPYSLGEKNGYQFIACQSCGSVSVDPLITQGEVDQFFGDVQPEIVHLPQPEQRISALKVLISKLVPHTKGRRFLDVSCQQGYAVMSAKTLGLKAAGISPFDFFIRFAKENYDTALFQHSSVAEQAAKEQQADILFSIESLCEQTDPEKYVANLAKLLAPDGILYLQEPDGNSFHIPRTFTNWAFVEPPLNFSYISKKGMTALLARHGLKIKKSFFTWGPFMRLIVVKK